MSLRRVPQLVEAYAKAPQHQHQLLSKMKAERTSDQTRIKEQENVLVKEDPIDNGGCEGDVREESFVKLPFAQAIRVARFPPGCRVISIHLHEGTSLAFNATVLDIGINLDSREETLYKVRFDVQDNFGWIGQPLFLNLQEENLQFAPFTPVWLDTSIPSNGREAKHDADDYQKEGLIMSTTTTSEGSILHTVQTSEHGDVQFYQVPQHRVTIRLVGSQAPLRSMDALNETAEGLDRMKVEAVKEEEPVAETTKIEDVKKEESVAAPGGETETETTKEEVDKKDEPVDPPGGVESENVYAEADTKGEPVVPAAMEAEEAQATPKPDDQASSEGRAQKVICIDIDEDDAMNDEDDAMKEYKSSSKKRKKPAPPSPAQPGSLGLAPASSTSLESSESTVASPPTKVPRRASTGGDGHVESAKCLLERSPGSKAYGHKRQYRLPDKLGVGFIKDTIMGEQGSLLKHLCAMYDCELNLRGTALTGFGAGHSSKDYPLYLDISFNDKDNMIQCCQALENLLHDSCAEQLRRFLVYKLTTLNCKERVFQKGIAKCIYLDRDEYMTMVRVGPTTQTDKGIVSLDHARRFLRSWTGPCRAVMPHPSEKHPQVAPHLLISSSALENVAGFCDVLFDRVSRY